VSEVRSRAALLAVVVLGVATVAGVLLVRDRSTAGDDSAGHGGGDAEDHGLPASAQARAAVAGEVVEASEAATVAREAVAGLLRLGAVRADYRAEGTEGGPVEGSVSAVRDARAFDLRETTALADAVVVEERRVVDGTMYLRVFVEDGEEVPWDVVPDEAFVDIDHERVLVAKGRAVESLDRLLLLVDEVPFSAERLGADPPAYRLRFDAAAIGAHFAATGLEVVEHPDELTGSTVFELVVGDDGSLAELWAYGVLFQDGEALSDASVGILYAQIAAPLIEAPAEDVRG
jgi:hypothetical protein